MTAKTVIIDTNSADDAAFFASEGVFPQERFCKERFVRPPPHLFQKAT